MMYVTPDRIHPIKHKEFIISTRLFYLLHCNGRGWVRLFRTWYGIKWKDTTRHSLMFSERNGFLKAITIGKWRISILKP